MQLDGLLQSLKINSNSFFDRVSVVYRASNQLHLRAYDKVINKFNNVYFFKESLFFSFKFFLKKLLHLNFPYVVFMTDDDLLYQKITSDEKNVIMEFLHKKNDLCTFSIRLGLNCIYSHPADKYFKLKNYQVLDNFIVWNWREQEEGDFNYPLSLDGHIFRKDIIQEILSKFKGKNPNMLEAFMQSYNYLMPNFMMSFNHSRLVGIPVNLVSNSSSNYYGKKYYYSTAELAKKYLSGYVIDINKMNFQNITSAHQEIEFIFTKE